MVKINTKIIYLYRDADNYKVHNECIISGSITDSQRNTILSSLDMGEFFIPHQVGLPERRFDTYNPEVDHPWFELREEWFSHTEGEPTVNISVDSLVNNFLKCKDCWVEEQSQKSEKIKE